MKKYILISSIASILTISIIWGIFYWKSNTNLITPEKKEEVKEIVINKANMYESLEKAKANPVKLSEDNNPVKIVEKNFLTNLDFFVPEKWTYIQNDNIGEISFNDTNKVKIFKFQIVLSEGGQIVLDGGSNNSYFKNTLIGKENLFNYISAKGPSKTVENIKVRDEIYVHQIQDTSPDISIDRFISNDTKKNSYIWILSKKDTLIYVEGEFSDLSKESYFDLFILPGFEIK